MPAVGLAHTARNPVSMRAGCELATSSPRSLVSDCRPTATQTRCAPHRDDVALPDPALHGDHGVDRHVAAHRQLEQALRDDDPGRPHHRQAIRANSSHVADRAGAAARARGHLGGATVVARAPGMPCPARFATRPSWVGDAGGQPMCG